MAIAKQLLRQIQKPPVGQLFDDSATIDGNTAEDLSTRLHRRVAIRWPASRERLSELHTKLARHGPLLWGGRQ